MAKKYFDNMPESDKQALSDSLELNLKADLIGGQVPAEQLPSALAAGAIVQTTGTGTASAMSQKAVTDELGELELKVDETKLYKPLANPTYNDDIAECYIVALPSGDPILKCYNNLAYLYVPLSGVLANTGVNVVENNLIYPIKVYQSNNASYPINTIVGYVIFRDVTTFLSKPSSSENSLINRSIAENLTNSPRIADHLHILLDNSVSTTKIVDSAISIDKIGFCEVGKNKISLFEEDGWKYHFALDGKGSTYPNNDYNTTAYIPVIYGNNYIFSNNGEAKEMRVLEYYTSSKTFISSQIKVNQTTLPSNCEYIRISYSVSYLKPQLEAGSSITIYEPYKKYFKKRYISLEDKSVNLINFANSIYDGINSNILDPVDDIIQHESYYINSGNGKVTFLSSANTAYGYTDYIQIDSRGLYTNCIYIAGTVIGGAYYSDKDESFFITGFRSRSIPYIEGAKYVRFSLTTTITDRLVSRGVEEIRYVPFEGKKLVISPDILPTDNIKENPLAFALPDVINSVVGDTLQLYYRSIIRDYDPYQYDINVICNIGAQYPRYFEVTPTASHIGNHNITFSIRESDSTVILTKTVVLKVSSSTVSSPADNINILCVGASATNPGVWSGELKRRLTGSGGIPIGLSLNNITFVGRKNTIYDAKFEATGGYSFTSYTSINSKLAKIYFNLANIPTTVNIGDIYSYAGSQYTISEINIPSTYLSFAGYISFTILGDDLDLPSGGTLNRLTGTGDNSLVCQFAETSGNPFAYNGSINLAQYASDYCNGQIDVVCTELFGNGEIPYDSDLADKMIQMQSFIDMFLQYNPNIKFLIGMQWPTDIKGGTGTSYRAVGGYSLTNGIKFTIMNLLNTVQAYINDNELGDNVFIVNWLNEFDSENNYQYINKPVNPRAVTNSTYNTISNTEIFGINGVHPSNIGYLQMADSMYRVFVSNILQ